MKKEEIFEYVKKQYGTVRSIYGHNHQIMLCYDIRMENGMLWS